MGNQATIDINKFPAGFDGIASKLRELCRLETLRWSQDNASQTKKDIDALCDDINNIVQPFHLSVQPRNEGYEYCLIENVFPDWSN